MSRRSDAIAGRGRANLLDSEPHPRKQDQREQHRAGADIYGGCRRLCGLGVQPGIRAVAGSNRPFPRIALAVRFSAIAIPAARNVVTGERNRGEGSRVSTVFTRSR